MFCFNEISHGTFGKNVKYMALTWFVFYAEELNMDIQFPANWLLSYHVNRISKVENSLPLYMNNVTLSLIS